MKKKYLQSLFFLLLYGVVSGQNFGGYVPDNYSGIYGVGFQPASVADSRLIFDINLIGISTTTWNNYLGIKGNNLSGNLFDIPTNSNWQTGTYTRNPKTDKNYYGYLNADIVMPLSFMLTTSPKAGIGFMVRNRSFVNADKINGTLLNSAYEENRNPLYYNKRVDGSRMRYAVANYNDFGLTYGRILVDKEEHFIKAGATFKLIQGLAGSYMYARDLQMTILNDSLADFHSVDIDYGSGTNIPPAVPNPNPNPNQNLDWQRVKEIFRASFPTGAGADFGVVYEYRPEIHKHEYTVEGQTKRFRFENKYKFRAGVSLLDVGYVAFKRETQIANFAGVDRDSVKIRFNGGNNVINNVSNFFNTNFNTTVEDSVRFRMALPTAISAQFDYKITNSLYVSANYYGAFKRPGWSKSVHGISNLTIAPRIEQRLYGFAIPFTIDQNFEPQLGFMVRGPSFPVFPVHFFMGSNNMLGVGAKKRAKGFDLYFGLHVPLAYRNNDNDFDGIKNRKDRCPDTYGMKIFRGCPDSDKDKVPDIEDECPLDSGKVALKGCPDKDDDKIPDAKDECPTVKGLAKLNGCPDKDNDLIPDHKDECPEERGKKEMNGCPDKDNDEVADYKDKCPTEKGRKETEGCPDQDTDGVADKEDKCPKEPGSVATNGCPDKDNDTVIDKEDKCPDTPGVKENKGCPPVEEKAKVDPPVPVKPVDNDYDGVPDKDDNCPEKYGTVANKGCPEVPEFIRKAFDVIEFDIDKAEVRPVYFEELDGLAFYLKINPEIRLLIKGNTDSDGKDTYNQQLSLRRADAIKKYLVDHGVEASRLETQAYGESRPKRPNDAPDDKQRNRRVEVQILQ
ncbi:MAG: OmpA family protein [Bacteroidia bacterium]|nr:OmpA family protein [Bacteroidia bacterium]